MGHTPQGHRWYLHRYKLDSSLNFPCRRGASKDPNRDFFYNGRTGKPSWRADCIKKTQMLSTSQWAIEKGRSVTTCVLEFSDFGFQVFRFRKTVQSSQYYFYFQLFTFITRVMWVLWKIRWPRLAPSTITLLAIVGFSPNFPLTHSIIDFMIQR